MTAPSAWTLQQVMSIAQATLARMEQDGTLDTDEAALMDALRQEVPEVDKVMVALARASTEAQTHADAVGCRIEDLQVRRARFQRQYENYRGALNAVMHALGITTWKHAECSAGLSPGRPGVVITDEAALPDAFVRVERKPDKALIKAALDSNLPVPGATISNGLPTLTVRTK